MSIGAYPEPQELPAISEWWRYVGASGQPAFVNSWVNHGTWGTSARFYKDALGTVHIEGLVKSGGVGTSVAAGQIFVLPMGYRPGPLVAATSLIFPTVANDAFAQVRVFDSGEVVAWVGSNVWFSLDAISFRAV